MADPNIISIKSLRPSYVNKPLDVMSIVNTNHSRSQREFDVDQLLNFKRRNKKLAELEYKRILRNCLNNIRIANQIFKYSIIYKVPLTVSGVHDYNIIDCTDFLLKELNELKFTTMRINNQSIFIDWTDIEEKLNLSSDLDQQV